MSTFGKNIVVSLFGESHGEKMGITIHHLPCGISIDLDKMHNELVKRKGLKEISTARNELDELEIISGYFEGKTTGAPLTIIINNRDTRSRDYHPEVPRPSHADYVAYCKYHGYNDYRGGGHFSGRLTALIVCLGSICEDILKEKNIQVISRIKSIKDIIDEAPLNYDLKLKDEIFPVVDSTIKEEMLLTINQARHNLDSVGGVVETNIYNVPIGLGEPFFDSFESMLSHLLFSIPGVKGVEFGGGFAMSHLCGSQCNDQMRITNGQIEFISNNNGGINGGITNGNVINFKTAFKPTPSISLAQQSVNLQTMENQILEIVGRHDPVICVKGLHVVNAMAKYCVLEMFMESRLWD